MVPFTAGGTTSVVGRMVAQFPSPVPGQPVVIENSPGATGAVGATYTTKAKPDGHTLMGRTISTHAINAGLYKNLPYDPVKGFEPIIDRKDVLS
jgi:tripartite-type tricarboxylate transporter receptor subunit TctC